MVALQDSLALKNIVSQFLEKRHTAYRHLTITTPIRRKRGFSKLPTRYLTFFIRGFIFQNFSKLPTRYLTLNVSVNACLIFSKLPTRYLTRTFLFIFLYCKRIFANFYDFDPFFGLILILLIINKLKTVLKKGSINLKIRDGCCFA